MNSKNITLGGFHLKAGAKMCSDRKRKNQVEPGHKGFSNIYTRACLWLHAHIFSVAASTHPLQLYLQLSIYISIYSSVSSHL